MHAFSTFTEQSIGDSTWPRSAIDDTAQVLPASVERSRRIGYVRFTVVA
jgi:hypothetical protein